MINEQNNLYEYIRDIPDFPKKRIIFKDITPLLKDKYAFKKAIDALAEKFKAEKIDVVVGIEARGFILGAAVAYALGVGFIPIRKQGKLPHTTQSITYELEYGSDVLEIHEDALAPNSRVLVVDDLLATGGTVKAVVELLRKQRAVIVSTAFLMELDFLKGREKINTIPVYSLMHY